MTDAATMEAPAVSAGDQNDPMERLKNAVRDLTPAQVIPGRDRIWVQRVPAFDTTQGGLHVPDQARKQQNICRVLAIGPGVDDLAPDDVVVLESFSGDSVGFLDEYVMISANFVMAKLDI
jgi:co-chaperonin GroES (HSP10)